jgi:hypothetical protein
VRTHLIFIDRIAAGTYASYLASRSMMSTLQHDELLTRREILEKEPSPRERGEPAFRCGP